MDHSASPPALASFSIIVGTPVSAASRAGRFWLFRNVKLAASRKLPSERNKPGEAIPIDRNSLIRRPDCLTNCLIFSTSRATKSSKLSANSSRGRRSSPNGFAGLLNKPILAPNPAPTSIATYMGSPFIVSSLRPVVDRRTCLRQALLSLSRGESAVNTRETKCRSHGGGSDKFLCQKRGFSEKIGLLLVRVECRLSDASSLVRYDPALSFLASLATRSPSRRAASTSPSPTPGSSGPVMALDPISPQISSPVSS